MTLSPTNTTDISIQDLKYSYCRSVKIAFVHLATETHMTTRSGIWLQGPHLFVCGQHPGRAVSPDTEFCALHRWQVYAFQCSLSISSPFVNLKREFCEYLETPQSSLKSHFCLEGISGTRNLQHFSFSEGTDDVAGVRDDCLDLKMEYLLQLKFNICGHHITAWK